MGRERLCGMAAAMVLALAAGGCSGAPVPPPPPPPPPTIAAAAPEATTPAPEADHPVGLRVLHLRRGPGRPLPTLLFYPAAHSPVGHAGRFTGTAYRAGAAQVITDGAPATGRFPIVLFSHGLHGSPQVYSDALAAWAAAGFVVAAPNYPFTSTYADRFRRRDIKNQPADLRYVLSRVRRLATTAGDPLRGRIDGSRVAAIGHSAGGYTTTGLFTAGHDRRLRAGLVLAGWLAPGAFAGPSATMLFLQGSADPVVPPRLSRQAYEKVPWPKAYVLMRGLSHADFMRPGDPGYPRVASTTLDFLRWTLKSDAAARRRLPPLVRSGDSGM
ncbi:MAG: prolyl oligopeptidase family serine peptidase [Actinoplanes sp.]